jgi:GWxTD domain-containing protein
MAQRSNVPTRLVIRPQQPMWVVPDSGLSEPVSLPWIDGDEWAFEVKSISTNEELSTYAQLQTTQQRDDFIAQFWARRDPTPGTPENEFRDEYDRRTRLARQQYTIPDFPGVFGHDTDRGRVHVMFGAPDNIDKGEIGAGLHRSLGEVAHIFDPAGISCTAMLPAGTYTFSAAVTLVAGGTQSDTVAFEVP